MRTTLFLAIVGALVVGVALLAYRSSRAENTVTCSWEVVSLSNFLFHEMDGEWWGGDERATVLLRIERKRSRVSLSTGQGVQVFWVELGEVGLSGLELRFWAPAMPPVRCAVEVDPRASATIVAISGGSDWPGCPLPLQRPGEEDARLLRDAIRRSLEPGARDLVWREVAPGTYQRGMMGPDLAFVAFPEDDITREPMREEAELRATIWTIEDQRANRAPFR